jgi:N-acetylneuraminic acid mutarotase
VGGGTAAPAWPLRPRGRHGRHSVYALGGTGADGAPVLAVERFDGTRWSEEATLPGDGLNAPAAAMLDGRIYVIGGF